jgi:4-amino-4-deoxy-L-arabinose transferase-like glycosyltransferase
MSNDRRNLLLILLLVGTIVLISATAPSSSYAHAQNYQMDCVLSAVTEGHWLLPHSQTRGLDRKPPLYVWLDAPILKLTGIYNDFTYRIPNTVALAAMAVLIYYLGKRWYSRRVGLLAACLWVTSLHMGKLSYIALTDMLLCLFFAGSIACADRLLFHRAPRNKRWAWGVGLWLTMILAALTKGWGLVNLPLLAVFIALASGVGAGFRVIPGRKGLAKAGCIVQLLVRRWWRAAKGLYLGWGLLAMVLALAPILGAMFWLGGAEFRHVVYIEVLLRFTGLGGPPPPSHSMPAIVVLLYYQLPVTIFALGTLLLARPRRWLVGRSPLRLPLCWVAALVLPFSLSRGFRPDYLAPCYAGLALLAAWGIDQLAQLGPRRWQWSLSRHVMAAAPIGCAAALICLPVYLVVAPHLPHGLRRVFHTSDELPAAMWTIIYCLPLAGVALLRAAIRASLRWKIATLAVLATIAMVGLMFLNGHVLSRHAAWRDGETMNDFATMVRPIIGDEPYAICQAEESCVPDWLGRFGHRLVTPKNIAQELNDANYRWLVISERGLVASGAAVADPKGSYDYCILNRRFRFSTSPEQFGVVRAVSKHEIDAYDFGRLFLVELSRPVQLQGKPLDQRFLPRPTVDED